MATDMLTKKEPVVSEPVATPVAEDELRLTCDEKALTEPKADLDIRIGSEHASGKDC